MAKPKEIESLLRPVFEARSSLLWSFAFVWCVLVGAVFQLGWFAVAGLCLVTGMMALRRGVVARTMVVKQLALIGRPVEIMPVRNLLDAMPAIGNNLWLGRGWRWEPSHTALAYEVSKRDLSEIYPERWMLRLLGIKRNPADERGLQWIHGLHPEESDVTVSMDALKGHCAIIATTGAIKTRLAALFITQLIAKGDVVIVFDPKGDHELREICRMAAEYTGIPDKFMMLHPAFASKSIRLDMLKNWDRVSQVASRISMVLGSQEGDSFKEFCWNAVHRITNGIKYVGRRVNLLTLKMAMESRTSVERLAYEALKKFFTEEAPQLRDRVTQELNKLAGESKRPPKKGAIETGSPELTAMIMVFLADVPESPAESERVGVPMKPEEVSGLVNILEANKEWFGKMIVSILPMLTKLTTDDLRGLLSPDYEDLTDERPIMDMKRIVEGRHVLYIGTDALADPSVGKALSAMCMADLASVAAEIYNHGLEGDDGSSPRRIHLVVDEWGDAMCEPLVQQANKGRGAGVFIWALGQTFSDLVHAFGGDTASAKRFMGNMNNLIIGAIQDPDTQEMVSEKFGLTNIKVFGESKGVGSKTEDTGMEFSANHGLSASDKEVPLIPPELLPQMPDLQYFALLNRSFKFKGRIPVVQLQ
ncbi:conjugative transfer system coupling protein TraD [Acidovorax sp. LjRoot118]|uniref:conjugative transfer system coupling protein TraD n=1 Tax=Acidovorax sp. LjRoot118 TaxID=3342256 RepID=UPI003ECDC948